MIDQRSELSVTRQAKLLGIGRGSVYYRPRPVSESDLKLMQRIDRLHLELPFAGSRMLQGLLKQEGFEVGRLHVASLMKRMGIEALYRRPNTSKPAPGHKIYPYLLRGLVIDRPNRVWAMDITYIPMARGFIYLAAVIDWFTRRVLSWRVSIISTGGLDGCSHSHTLVGAEVAHQHSGRRTFITNAARKISTVGGSLRDVQVLAGHSSLTTTQRYIEVNAETKRRVVGVV